MTSIVNSDRRRGGRDGDLSGFLLGAEVAKVQSEEPGAGKPHAGICAGGAPKGAFLPRWFEMMKSMAMLISLLFAGCASVEETNQISMAERVLNAVPPTVVAQIPAKLADFKPGMNISQVHDLLGIKSEHKFLSRGGGPFSNYHLIYHLRQGYNLELVPMGLKH